MFEDIKRIIKNYKPKKDRQYNDPKKYKRTNNGLQNITQKSKDWATRNKLNTGDELLCSGSVGSSCSTSGTRHHTIVANPVLHRKYSLLYWSKACTVFLCTVVISKSHFYHILFLKEKRYATASNITSKWNKKKSLKIPTR